MMSYSGSEWALLTGLPVQVVAAAARAGPGESERMVAEGRAGSAAIAAGRSSDSELVRAVVATIYLEADSEPRYPATGYESGQPTAPDGMTPRLRAACRAAVELLAERADPADSAAYRQWVQSTAARVRRAAARPDAPGTTLAGDPVRRFLAELGSALRLC